MGRIHGIHMGYYTYIYTASFAHMLFNITVIANICNRIIKLKKRKKQIPIKHCEPLCTPEDFFVLLFIKNELK